MNIQQIEMTIIDCLKANIRDSGEIVPAIARTTVPMSDIAGFDSLRTLEILIELEEKLHCELPPEKIFSGLRPNEMDIAYIAIAVKKITEEAEE